MADCDFYVVVRSDDGELVGQRIGNHPDTPVAKDEHGIIGRTMGGNLCFLPWCCASPSNPCGDLPEMLVTVTGTTGTINWCGETWNLPDDSGVEKSVCPDTYSIVNTIGPQTGGGYDSLAHFGELWEKSNIELLLYRNGASVHWTITPMWGAGFFTPPAWARSGYFPSVLGNKNKLSVKGGKDVNWFFGGAFGSQTVRPVNITYTAWTGAGGGGWSTYQQIGNIMSVPAAETTDYRLTDAYFGSYTTGGVTYSWAKGQGWD